MAGDAVPGDGPVVEFEGLPRQFVEQAQGLTGSQARLRELVRVNNDLTSNLDLPTVLRRLVEIGLDLVQARYGAMGVVGEESRLEQFIHVGMEEAVVARIAHLPEGKGLLGALIDDPTHPVRLASIAADARSSGFPAHHPPMESFIGVPIRVRDKIYGNLYLTDSRNGAFTDDDEELAQALAATAGIAIQNARLYEDAEYRARWSTALVDVSRNLMSVDEGDELDALIERLRELADADLVSVALVSATGEVLAVDRAVGTGAESLMGASFRTAETVAATPLQSGEPALIANLHEHPALGFEEQALLGNAMIIPFHAGGEHAGVLCVARHRGRPAFASRDVEMGQSFAGHVSVAHDRKDARVTRRRIALLEDRTRIARDLHDHVIQRLFATGLNLQATAAGAEESTSAKIMEQIRELDGAIAQIRQSIFAIQGAGGRSATGLRARVLEIVDHSGSRLPNKPRVTFLGPVDLMADPDLADDVSAVVTEALSNAVRHADAAHVDVTVSAVGGHLTIEVVDDGVGPGDLTSVSGLGNLRDRAVARGGTFTMTSVAGGGSRATWTVPV